MMINTKNIGKALIDKSMVGWFKEDGYNFIISGYWLIKTVEEIKGSSLTKLIKLLGRVPNEGEGILLRQGQLIELTRERKEGFIEMLETGNNYGFIENTCLIRDTGFELYNIFKNKDDYIYIDKRFTDLLNFHNKDINIYGSTKFSPVLFEGVGLEQVLLLPGKFSEDSSYLKGVK